MEIRFISSLTSEDEMRVASALVDFVGTLLDQSSIAYALRVETESGTTFERAHTSFRSQEPADATSGDRPPPPVTTGRKRRRRR